MTYDPASFEAYIEANRDRFLNEFGQFIAQPSVAAQKRGVREMAVLVAARLDAIGAEVTVSETEDAPIVFAEQGPPDAPRTLLIYNHYDVQPEDPLDLWKSPPFEMTIREGRIYGRGVADDKGELLSRIQAVEAWLATQGELPVRIKWVIEGEEEEGSHHLNGWARAHAAQLQADGILWEGAGYDEEGRPTFGTGVKGDAYFELRCKGPSHDLHSSVAPIVPNPAWRLVWALSTLKNERDEITLDGYLDHVAPLSPAESAAIDAIPMAFEETRARYGIDQWLNGMSDYDARRRLYAAPTITICGFESGYTGVGSKTVLPSEAMVKLDFRLVPDLTPELAQDLLRQHLDRRGFTDISITFLGGEPPAKSPPGSLVERAAVAASQDALGQTPIMQPWAPGSGPMYSLSTMLGMPVVFAGTTWHPNSLMHAPNENIYVEDYFAAMRFLGAFLHRFATLEAVAE